MYVVQFFRTKTIFCLFTLRTWVHKWQYQKQYITVQNKLSARIIGTHVRAKEVKKKKKHNTQTHVHHNNGAIHHRLSPHILIIQKIYATFGRITFLSPDCSVLRRVLFLRLMRSYNIYIIGTYTHYYICIGAGLNLCDLRGKNPKKR